MPKTIDKPPYYAPTVRETFTVSLEDFSDEDIGEYMRHQGYTVLGLAEKPGHTGPDESLTLSEEELNRLWTLALCGQQQAACDWLCERVGEHIGRSLSPGEHGRAA